MAPGIVITSHQRTTLRDLPGRDLSPGELQDLVVTLAADHGLWDEHVALDADSRV